jgi:hypothetical protein
MATRPRSRKKRDPRWKVAEYGWDRDAGFRGKISMPGGGDAFTRKHFDRAGEELRAPFLNGQLGGTAAIAFWNFRDHIHAETLSKSELFQCLPLILTTLSVCGPLE